MATSASGRPLRMQNSMLAEAEEQHNAVPRFFRHFRWRKPRALKTDKRDSSFTTPAKQRPSSAWPVAAPPGAVGKDSVGSKFPNRSTSRGPQQPGCSQTLSSLRPQRGRTTGEEALPGPRGAIALGGVQGLWVSDGLWEEVSNEVWVEHFVYHALVPLTEGSSSRRCTLALFSEPTHGPRHKDRCR